MGCSKKGLGKSYYLTSYYPCPWESLLQGGSKKGLGTSYYLTSYYHCGVRFENPKNAAERKKRKVQPDNGLFYKKHTSNTFITHTIHACTPITIVAVRVYHCEQK